MSYLIKINDRTNDILHPDAVKLFPGFKKLTEDEVLYIVLTYDYCSPYSHFTLDDRRRRATMHVWNDNKLPELDKRDDIRFAIEAYKSLQYNAKEEFAKSLQRRVEQLSTMIEDGSANVEKTVKDIRILRAEIKELEQEVLLAYQEDGKLVGGGQRSFLENMLKNKQLYEAVKNTKPKV